MTVSLSVAFVFKSLRFFFEENIFIASAENAGAIITSKNILFILFASSSVISLLHATIPPKAL